MFTVVLEFVTAKALLWFLAMHQKTQSNIFLDVWISHQILNMVESSKTIAGYRLTAYSRKSSLNTQMPTFAFHVKSQNGGSEDKRGPKWLAIFHIKLSEMWAINTQTPRNIIEMLPFPIKLPNLPNRNAKSRTNDDRNYRQPVTKSPQQTNPPRAATEYPIGVLTPFELPSTFIPLRAPTPTFHHTTRHAPRTPALRLTGDVQLFPNKALRQWTKTGGVQGSGDRKKRTAPGERSF